MFRSVIVSAVLVLGSGAALADDVFSCRSIIGASGGTLDFRIVGNATIEDATFVGGDGATLSTSTTDPATLATVTGVNLDNQVSFNLNRDGVDKVLVNLVTRFSGGGDIATGNIKLDAGGIVVFRCDVAHEG